MYKQAIATKKKQLKQWQAYIVRLEGMKSGYVGLEVYNSDLRRAQEQMRDIRSTIKNLRRAS